MTTSTVFIYTPVDENGESHRQMEEASRKLRLGSAFWKNFATEDLNIAGALDDPVCALMSVANRQNSVTRDVSYGGEEFENHFQIHHWRRRHRR